MPAQQGGCPRFVSCALAPCVAWCLSEIVVRTSRQCDASLSMVPGRSRAAEVHGAALADNERGKEEGESMVEAGTTTVHMHVSTAVAPASIKGGMIEVGVCVTAAQGTLCCVPGHRGRLAQLQCGTPRAHCGPRRAHAGLDQRRRWSEAAAQKGKGQRTHRTGAPPRSGRPR